MNTSAETVRETGVVVKKNPKKRFGRIAWHKRPGKENYIFFRAKECPSFDEVTKYCKVSFILVTDENGLKAVNVTPRKPKEGS
jgi:cold shock CspA family protein